MSNDLQEFKEIQEKRNKEWMKKNNIKSIDEDFVEVARLQDLINFKIRSFKKQNKCDLLIDVVNGEIKIGAYIDIDNR